MNLVYVAPIFPHSVSRQEDQPGWGQHLDSLEEEIKDSAVLGRRALPQKALESVLKTAAFPKNLEKDANLRFGGTK